jgi:hypothetical protein
MTKIWFCFYIISGIIFFSGCGASATKIVIPSYTAPKEASKLSKIQTKDEFISDGAYLALWINPEVKGAKQTNIKLQEMLIESVKEKITQTNFIAIDPLGDKNGVTLGMKIANYDYKKSLNKISMVLEVVFTLSRGADEFLVKRYSVKKNRESRDAMKLPSQNRLALQAADKVVKYFISDISPLKTSQLREFKPFVGDLKPVLVYIKQKNYKGAIKLMNYYKGTRDMEFYYNLAVLYEALASENENLKLLKLANDNYNKSIDMGGIDDELIVGAKARFDSFYELLDKTKKQDRANQALRDNRDEMLGSSDDEYR